MELEKLKICAEALGLDPLDVQQLIQAAEEEIAKQKTDKNSWRKVSENMLLEAYRQVIKLIEEKGELIEEIARLQEALTFYANSENWDEGSDDEFSFAELDAGVKARKILKEKS